MSSDAVAHRQWLTSYVDLGGARLVVDLGCGSGRDLALLAERASPQVRFIGIDRSASKLEEANRLCGSDPRLTFVEQHLDCTLPFADGEVDVVCSNNTIECMVDKGAFLNEVHRVLRPGGQVVFAHWDWEAQALDAPDRDLVRRVIRAFADWRQPWMDQVDGWMGRRLWATFQRTRLFDGCVHARVLINTEYAEPYFGHALISEMDSLVEVRLISSQDRDDLRRHVEALAARNEYFYSITGYVYVGRAA
jgi:SAM-dependent methyltransferase